MKAPVQFYKFAVASSLSLLACGCDRVDPTPREVAPVAERSEPPAEKIPVSTRTKHDEAKARIDGFIKDNSTKVDNQYFFILRERRDEKNFDDLYCVEDMQIDAFQIDVTAADRKNGIEEFYLFIVKTETYRPKFYFSGPAPERWRGGEIFGGVMLKVGSEWRIQTLSLNPFRKAEDGVDKKLGDKNELLPMKEDDVKIFITANSTVK